MKNILLIALLSTTLFACVEVKFKQSQPEKTKSLAEFPQEIQGLYLISMKDSINEKDTIEIGKNYFTDIEIVQKKNSETVEKQKKSYLSDSLILKQVNKNFTISFKDKDFWMVFLLKPTPEGYAAFWIDGSDEDAAEQLNLITKVETIKDEEGKVDALILNPKKKTFLKMVENKRIFSKLYELKKIQP